MSSQQVCRSTLSYILVTDMHLLCASQHFGLP